MKIGPFYFGLERSATQLSANLMYAQLGRIQDGISTIMVDQSKLLAAIARLQAADAKSIEMLTALRDSNKAAAAQIAALSDQLASVPNTDAIQTSLDGLADQLNNEASAVEAAVQANSAVPNLPPAAPDAQPDPATQNPA